MGMKVILEEEKDDAYEDVSFPFRRFPKLTPDALQELLKIPGLKEGSRLRDESGVICIHLQAETFDSFLNATKVLDVDPLIQITPNMMLDPPLRHYQFDVHQFYSQQTSTFLKANPAIPIPAALRPGNPVNLMLNFRSALVASLHEIRRFQGNNNPAAFNGIPKGTELGEMTIIYGGRGLLMHVGPISYYR